MSIKEEISIPKDNVNDEFVLIKNIYVKNNDQVSSGDLLLDYETSKVNFEIHAKFDGFIKLLCDEGDTVKINQSILIISDKIELEDDKSLNKPTSSPVFSKKALLKIKELDLSKESFKGENIITEKMVLDYLDINDNNLNREGQYKEEMSSIEQAISKTVNWQKENTVPAYLEIIIDQSYWDNYSKILMDANKLLVNPLLGILAYRVASIVNKFPRINSYCDGENIITYKSVNLGFTVEVKDRLYLVVVHNADKMDELAFVKELFKLQKKAFSDKLSPKDTSGATIAFTSLSKEGVIRHIPILPTKTGLIIAHSSPFEHKKDIAKSVTIGATYDHRYLSGGYVAKVLNYMYKK